MGYHNGNWEFCRNVNYILQDLENLGGLMKLNIKLPDWKVSDDTIMHIATAKALLENWNNKEQLLSFICKHYVSCMQYMDGRSPGIQCVSAMRFLSQGKWNSVPFSSSGGGCGASMRTMCIGLFFYRPEQLEKLIEISLESSRMTHNHPTGFFGGVTSAVFTSWCIQKIPMEQWGYKLINEVIPKCIDYLKVDNRDMEYYQKENHLIYFVEMWKKYLELRCIQNGQEKAHFPPVYGHKEREEFYKSISYSGWGGSSGHDSVIISYDALLGCNGSWEEFCHRGIIHGGDNDSTGAIGGAWFGAIYGMKGVPQNHYIELEYLNELESLANQLLQKANDPKIISLY